MLNCVIDWLTFTKFLGTMYENEEVDLLMEMLVPSGTNISGWQHSAGRFGYKQMMTYDGIEIMFDGNKSICVNITGSGCRTYESIHGSFDNLIFEIVYNKYRVTRLDLAVDDRGTKTMLDIDKIYKLSDMLYRGDKLNKTCRVWGEFRSINRIQGTDGTTLYYGSNSSEKRVKIYDKAAEQKIEDEKWIRVELTLKNDYAFKALDIINAGVPAGEVFSGVVRNYLFF